MYKDYTENPTDVVLEGLAPKVGNSLLLLFYLVVVVVVFAVVMVVVVVLCVQERLHGVPH